MLTQALFYGRSTKPLAWVVPYERWPGIWRIHWPDGSTSDMLNLARAKDAAAAHAERGPPERDRRRFRWRIGPLENDERAWADASNALEARDPPAPTTRWHGPQEPTTDTPEAAAE
jgi:hypothetical protein